MARDRVGDWRVCPTRLEILPSRVGAKGQREATQARATVGVPTLRNGDNMRSVDAVIISITDGTISELEFWRNHPVDYRTYDATSERTSRLAAALCNTKIYHTKLGFYRKDMTIHIEV